MRLTPTLPQSADTVQKNGEFGRIPERDRIRRPNHTRRATLPIIYSALYDKELRLNLGPLYGVPGLCGVPGLPLSGSPVTPEFICLLLRTARFHEIVAGYTNGTTVNMLPIDGLLRPEFVVPSEEMAWRFHDLAIPIFEEIERAHKESTALQHTRDALLPKLLSGEVQVDPAA